MNTCNMYAARGDEIVLYAFKSVLYAGTLRAFRHTHMRI